MWTHSLFALFSFGASFPLSDHPIKKHWRSACFASHNLALHVNMLQSIGVLSRTVHSVSYKASSVWKLTSLTSSWMYQQGFFLHNQVCSFFSCWCGLRALKLVLYTQTRALSRVTFQWLKGFLKGEVQILSATWADNTENHNGVEGRTLSQSASSLCHRLDSCSLVGFFVLVTLSYFNAKINDERW